MFHGAIEGKIARLRFHETGIRKDAGVGKTWIRKRHSLHDHLQQERNGIESDYIRVDSQAATKALVQFLDGTFPVSYHTIADYALPSEP